MADSPKGTSKKAKAKDRVKDPPKAKAKDREKDPPKPKGKRKRQPPVYVEVEYPFWLGVASFAWALAGWLAATAAPHLAFVPLVGVLHLLLPAVTVGLIGVNLFFAV